MLETLSTLTSETYVPFIYALVDPQELGHVRYVGMAPIRASRPYEHAKFARKAKSKPTHLINWIRKIQAEGREPTILILEQLSEASSQKFIGFIEQMYIKSLREIGHKLTNISDGGFGGETGRKGKPGQPHTAQSLLNLSKSLTGHIVTSETRERISRARRGKGHPHTTQSRKKIGAASKGRVISEETRVLMSEAQKGRVLPERVRKKISDTQKGRVFSEEHKINLSIANLKRPLSSFKRSAESINSQRQTMLRRTPEQIAEWAAKRRSTINARKAKKEGQ